MPACLRLLALFALLLVAACAGQEAPLYQPSSITTQSLQDSGAGKVNVGPFDSIIGKAGDPNSLSIRGRPFRSPYNSSFADYVATALRMELGQAGCYDPQSRVVVSGTLLANDLDATGFVTGIGEISVRFIIRRNGRTAFDKTLSKHHSWESSFVGAVAIPAAVREYGALVQLLVRDLVSDPDFIAATRPGADVALDSFIGSGLSG